MHGSGEIFISTEDRRHGVVMVTESFCRGSVRAGLFLSDLYLMGGAGLPVDAEKAYEIICTCTGNEDQRHSPTPSEAESANERVDKIFAAARSV